MNEDRDQQRDVDAVESLVGQRPFVGENVPSILFQIVHEPPSALVPKVAGLPSDVEEVLLRALAKNKSDRFASVSDFALALERASAGVESTAVVSPLPTTFVVCAEDGHFDVRPLDPFFKIPGAVPATDMRQGLARGRCWSGTTEIRAAWECRLGCPAAAGPVVAYRCDACTASNREGRALGARRTSGPA